jgi:hypothetical protein
MDALLVINELNDPEYIDQAGLLPVPPPSYPPTFHYDVYPDGYAAPLDALLVINYLNEDAKTEGEQGSAADSFSISRGLLLDTLPFLGPRAADLRQRDSRDSRDENGNPPDAHLATVLLGHRPTLNPTREGAFVAVLHEMEDDLEPLIDVLAADILDEWFCTRNM